MHEHMVWLETHIGPISMVLMWATYVGVAKQIWTSWSSGIVKLHRVWMFLVLVANATYTAWGASLHPPDPWITFSRVPGFAIAALALFQCGRGYVRFTSKQAVSVVVGAEFLLLLGVSLTKVSDIDPAILNFIWRSIFSLALTVGLAAQVHMLWKLGTKGADRFYWTIMLVTYGAWIVFGILRLDFHLAIIHALAETLIVIAWVMLLARWKEKPKTE